jgi:carbonic anhydrase/acetyltransferase-like protein (isoleucine patch superfamily)
VIYALGERRLETGGDFFVAPSADLIGSVRLAHEASVWFGCVLRGDSDWIEIGAGSNVQDGTVMHTDPGVPLRLGAGVSVGHVAFLHGCTVGDHSLIANGARVLDRVTIGSHCIVAAGALIPPDKIIPDGSVVMGAPGKIVREATARDLEMIARTAEHYRHRAALYRAALRVDQREP